MELKEVNDKYILSEIEGIMIKPFLAIEEINDIANQMLETDSQIERYMIKICKVTEYCTNIDLDEFTDEDGSVKGEEVYNLVAEIRLIDQFDEIIDNYYMIDRLVKNSESTYAIGKMFVDKLGETLKGFDMNKIQNGFEGLKEVIK